MGERWDRDRFLYERSRDRDRDQSREQSRGDDDRPWMRGGRGGPDRGDDRGDDRQERRFNRSFDDDDVVRDRRYYPEEPRPRREPLGPEHARRAPPVMERERERDSPRRASPPRRPGFLRRQSSLDTFDRRPGHIFREHEEYGPPARREDIRRDDYRAPPYTPIPLPKARGLPPPSRYPDQGFYDDLKTAEPSHFGDDDFQPPPERVREREYTRTRKRRDHSRDSFSTRTRSHRSSSVSSSTSSRSSSSSGGTTVRSEYPKKGKTRIPSKLVSKRALIDLEYPFFEEGNTIIVQKALGQDNIDELLKVSEDYKKVEMEILASRAPPPKGPVAALPAPPPATQKASPPPPAPAPETRPPPEESRPAPPPEFQREQQPPPPPVAAPAPAPTPAPAPPPVMRNEGPPPLMRNYGPPPPQAPVIIEAGPPEETWEEETYIRDYSPSRASSASSWDTSSHSNRRRRRKSAGPVALFERSRSRSRGGHELRAEIRALERELAHRPKGGAPNREMVRAERLPDGQVVIYEEQVEKVVEHRKPPRIEKDKKGRMSISVPKYR